MRKTALSMIAGLIVVGALAVKPDKAKADGDPTEVKERCSTRLSIALLGKSPTAPVTQDAVDTLVKDPAFVERFARYVNRRFNPEPGATVAEDASYTLAKHVLEKQLPWSEMFVGKFSVADTVTVDAKGLGYFRSDAWMRRYAGNEQDGYMLGAAYRILQNTTGLELMATTNVVGVDRTAAGREAAGCRGCHYDNWYALDKVARVLPRRQGMGRNMTFTPPTDGPQQILDGKTITNDAELVDGLVKSNDFAVNTCRLAFSFLYGRPENTCEAPVFERCLDAFAKDGTMQSAVATIAKDPSFCQ